MAWMSQIVRLTALNHVRKSSHRIAVPTDPQLLDHLGTADAARPGDDALLVSGDGHLSLEQTEFDDQVLGALSGVGKVARACLLLRIVQDLSYAEIAKTLQIPEGTAMSHVHRAKKMMRDRLKGHYRGAFAESDDRLRHE